MNKKDFIDKLSNRLLGLPQDDILERLTFYSEMIDDSIEEGLSEEDAILQIGSVDEIVSQIVADIPNSKFVIATQKTKRKHTMWEILFLILGSPIWISLLIAMILVVFSLYVVLWVVIISFWSVFISTIACSVCFIICGVAFIITENLFSGCAMLGMGLFGSGVAILLYFGCNALTKLVFMFTKWTVKSIDKLIKRRKCNE